MNKIYKSVHKKISNTLLFNEYVYFKKKYQDSLVAIDTGIFENKELSADLPKKYPFLNQFKPKQLKSIDSLELERIIIKTICSYLDSVFRNNQDNYGNNIKYREARKNIEMDFREIISFILALKKDKTIPTFKSFFKSDEKYYRAISLLKSNGFLNNDNELKNSGATNIAILICKLVDLGYLKNISRKKVKLAESLMNFFSFQFDGSYFSKIIKDYEDGDFEYEKHRIKLFNELDFLN